MGLSRNEWLILGASCAAGAIVLHCTTKYFRRCMKDRNHPFVLLGRISELYIYPLESGRGRQVQSMNCENYGGAHNGLEERHFVMVDMSNKTMITALTYPRLVLVDSDVRDGVLTLTTPESTPVHVYINEVLKANSVITYSLCENVVRSGLDCGAEAAEWCSRTLQIVAPIRLLYCQNGIAGPQSYFAECLAAWSSFQDPCVRLTPYMLINQESLDDLNSHFEPDGTPTTSRHFRPNIVVEGCKAYDEDKWMELRIGDVEFECFELCARSELITIDPEIGEGDQDKEPLKTLRKLRPKVDKRESCVHSKRNPTFGIRMRMIRNGTIKIGDNIEARKHRGLEGDGQKGVFL